jgi:hypothetical protein
VHAAAPGSALNVPRGQLARGGVWVVGVRAGRARQHRTSDLVVPRERHALLRVEGPDLQHGGVRGARRAHVFVGALLVRAAGTGCTRSRWARARRARGCTDSLRAPRSKPRSRSSRRPRTHSTPARAWHSRQSCCPAAPCKCPFCTRCKHPSQGSIPPGTHRKPSPSPKPRSSAAGLSRTRCMRSPSPAPPYTCRTRRRCTTVALRSTLFRTRRCTGSCSVRASRWRL